MDKTMRDLLSENAARWLASGDRGLSAETIFTLTTGVDAMGYLGCYDHPHDVSDFRRCRLLLDQCPELRSCLPRVAHLSKAWSSFVYMWDDLCSIHDEEAPNWRSENSLAPKTNAMIKMIAAEQ